MKNESLKLLKLTELEILKNFASYCAKFNLQYFLIGGALLGSVRYGGFIPWDDDIDVGTPRNDYEKLKELWKNESIDGFFFNTQILTRILQEEL